MRPGLLVVLAALVTACSGSSASIDSPSGTSSSSSSSSGGTGTATATPPESAFRGTTGGCGNVTAFRANDDRTQLLVVHADKAKLGLELLATKTFDLGRANDGLEVGVDVFPKAPTEPPYCTDFAYPDAPSPTRWTAEGGSISISLNPEPGATAGQYRATVRLKDVRLVGPERGVAVSVPNVEITNVLVGWLAG